MTSPVIGTPWKKLNAPVSEEAIEGVDKYWRAANYLSIGQIYLRSNPLMKEPFTREDVKHRLVGHWGTTPGLNFLIGHINRLIADHQQNTAIIMGPGHGGPAGPHPAVVLPAVQQGSQLPVHLPHIVPEVEAAVGEPAGEVPRPPPPPGQDGGQGVVHGIHGAGIVLLPGWHPVPLRSGNPGLHPRRRRAGLRPVPRLRRCDEQPEPVRSGHRRRRRS